MQLNLVYIVTPIENLPNRHFSTSEGGGGNEAFAYKKTYLFIFVAENETKNIYIFPTLCFFILKIYGMYVPRTASTNFLWFGYVVRTVYLGEGCRGQIEGLFILLYFCE